MTSQEALKQLCENCHNAIQQIPSNGDRPFMECPFRHISGDYCEEYEIVEKALNDYEKLKSLKLLPYPENDSEYRQDVVKRLMAFEVIKKYPKNRNSLANFCYMVNHWEKNNIEVTKELLETYDFPFEVEEYELLKEVLYDRT